MLRQPLGKLENDEGPSEVTILISVNGFMLWAVRRVLGVKQKDLLSELSAGRWEQALIKSWHHGRG